MTKEVSYAMLPEHMQSGARRYVEQGLPPGSFLRSVLENNLVAAASNGDSINQQALFVWATWLYSEAPGSCWGNQKAVQDWIVHQGMEGLSQAGLSVS